MVTTAAILGRVELLMSLPNIHDYKTTTRIAVFLISAALLAGQGRRLHDRALVFDGHVHAVDRVFYHGGDIGQRKPDGQFDLARA